MQKCTKINEYEKENHHESEYEHEKENHHEFGWIWYYYKAIAVIEWNTKCVHSKIMCPNSMHTKLVCNECVETCIKIYILYWSGPEEGLEAMLAERGRGPRG